MLNTLSVDRASTPRKLGALESSSPTLSTYADQIRRFSTRGPTEDELNKLLLADEGRIRVYYAPFEWVNPTAAVAIVGITPGKDSMLNAIRAAARALCTGESIDEALRQAKQTGIFSNMRVSIAQMLNELGLPKILGIHSALDLFGPRFDMLHPTSCIRNPVFTWSRKKQTWKGYDGHSPKLLKWPVGKRYIEKELAGELRGIPRALVVPCGEAVYGALRHLCAMKLLDGQRCLFWISTCVWCQRTLPEIL